jgi:hypothetical protein
MNAPKMPGFTAETAVYRTLLHYRGVSAFGHDGDTIRAAQLSAGQGACVDRCIDECIQAGLPSDYDYPIELLRQECSPICRTRCGFEPMPCPPETHLCWRTGNRPECCPTSYKCCSVLDATRYKYKLNCCPPGQECCFKFGCYTPGEYQCAENEGLCPTDRVICHGYCCGPGEVCTQDGCAPPALVCNNRRCAPGDRCTAEGCCPPGRAVCNNHCCPPGDSCTVEGCCPPGRAVCNNHCCNEGEFCCDGKLCCKSGTECRLVHGTSSLGCFDPVIIEE